VKSIYVSINELSDSQMKVMEFIRDWVKEKKKTVPLKRIIQEMSKKGMKNETTIYSLKILIKKGYIRRSQMISNKTEFVQLRNV